MRSNGGTAADETQRWVGRADERARLQALVERERVVALVGAAGVGKSALVRACWPAALVLSLAEARDDAEIDARIAAVRDAPLTVWDEVPPARAQHVAARAVAWRGGALVVVSRVSLAALPTIELGPLSKEEARALVAALETGDPLLSRIAAGGNPAAIARRLAAAHAALDADGALASDARAAAGAAPNGAAPNGAAPNGAAPNGAAPNGAAPNAALANLCAGRFAAALDGDPLIAAAALCGLDALDRAAALLHAHADRPRAPLVALALAWRRGELAACVERGDGLLASLDARGDALGHAIAAAIVARAAFGLGRIARAEELLRAVDGFVATGGAPSLAPFAELGHLLLAAFRGDWRQARERVARAHAAAPASPLCAVERSWAQDGERPAALDDAAAALFELRAAERALADGRLDDANQHARAAERFWRDAGASYERALALLARTEALVRAGDRATAAKLRQACAALADGGGYEIIATALALVDASEADRDGDLPAYVASLARARARAGSELHGRALVDACARVGLAGAAVVADGQPMRDRVARLRLARPADRLCSVGTTLRLLADDEPLPAVDAVADIDEGTLTVGRHEQPLAPQLLSLLEALAEAGEGGITPEALYLAVWQGEDYHPLRHRNAVYVAINRLRAVLEPIFGKESLRSTATHYALRPGLRIAICRAVRRLDVAAFASRARAGLDAPGYARRHRLPGSQARWELALHAAEGR